MAKLILVLMDACRFDAITQTEAFPLSQSFVSLPGAWFGYSCCGLCLV